MSQRVQTPAVAAGPLPPGVATDVPGGNFVPFVRAAAPPRTQISITTSATLFTGSQQSVLNTLPGTGYLLWIDNFVQLTSGSAANTSSNTVQYFEDAPWSTLASITLDDGGPQNVNLDGFSLALVNMYGGGWQVRDATLSTDAVNVYGSNPTINWTATGTSTATTAGTANFWLRVPLAINERNYWGLMGNQDRATKYNYRTDIAGSGSVYNTAPSPALSNVTISRTYGFLPVPGPRAADGRAQEQVPPGYGIIHYLTSVKSDALPTASSTINHYIRNLSNAVRLFILVFRQAALRANVSTSAQIPTQIDFLLGTDVLWSESYSHRRKVMWDRYGFDAPNGVLVYDMVRDFSALAGNELGDHYLYLGNISEAQFRVTYPAGYTASSTNSLTIITDSLYIPPGVDIYGAAA